MVCHEPPVIQSLQYSKWPRPLASEPIVPVGKAHKEAATARCLAGNTYGNNISGKTAQGAHGAMQRAEQYQP